MGQMTQFSILEQVTNLTKANEQLAARHADQPGAQPDRPHRLLHDRQRRPTGTGVVDKVAFRAEARRLTIGDVTRHRPGEGERGRMTEPIHRNPALLPPGLATGRSRGCARVVPVPPSAPQGPAFADVLRATTEQLHFSRHALQRLQRRGIELGEQTLQRLGAGVDRAAGKGSRDVGRVPRRHRLRGLRPEPHRRHGGRPRAHARAGVHEHRQRRHRMSATGCPTPPAAGPCSRRPRTPKGRDAPMMRGMFSAISGLKVTPDDARRDRERPRQRQHDRLQVRRTTFQDSLRSCSAAARPRTESAAARTPLQVGLGVQLGSIDNLMSGGAPQTTGNPLDVSIQGAGWFRVGPCDGRRRADRLPVHARRQLHAQRPTGTSSTQDGIYVGSGRDRGRRRPRTRPTRPADPRSRRAPPT